MVSFPRREACKAKVASVDTIIASIDSDAWLECYPEDGEITLYGEIGSKRFGCIDAATFKDALRQCGQRHVTLSISSPGGSVDEGIAIYNAISNHRPGVTIVVDSLAASIASYIFCAGQRRLVHDNAALMIHSPWAGLAGDANDFREAADLLDQYGERLVDAYARASGKSKQAIREIMAGEQWYFGQQIIDEGFADELVGRRFSIAASASPRRRKAAARIALAKARMATGCL